MILGHAHPPVLQAIAEAAANGTSFGAPTEREVQMAELVCQMVPNLERVRMVSSGTEACMTAIRVARGATGRNRIVKFAGCYHGHADAFLIQAGSGATTLGVPDSPGVTPGTAQDTLLAPFNNLAAVQALFAQHPGQIAAVIIEPVAGNMACIPPVPGFLEGLRALCDADGALLILDEVMTGFRLARGGAQERLGIRADLVTLGKVIGGGLPVAAFGGSARVMDYVAPVGPVYQAGTLSGNPLAMAAGLAQLGELNQHPEHYAFLDAQGAKLAQAIRQLLTRKGIAHRVNQVGSMLSLHFTETDVTDYASAKQQDVAAFNRMFHGLLRRGVYLPPSAFESWFLSTHHTDTLLEQTLAALEAVLNDSPKA
jgi:glutamate-1-semialdehyde 2,1-aminomutase